MVFLPLLIEEKEKKYYFYPDKSEIEDKIKLNKVKFFEKNYYYGSLDEIKEILNLYPEKYKKEAEKFLKNFEVQPKYFFVKNKRFLLDKFYLVGILNVTPDSFSDGGLFYDKDKAVERGLELEEEGADIIDVGGQSTRPGSDELNEEEELKRVIPVIEELSKKINIPISIDTTKEKVAEEAFKAGASILNDISALHFDEKMNGFLEKWKPSLILMHIKGKPKDMQKNTNYNHLPYEIATFIKEGIEKAERAGISKDKILVDPGIGFGKDYNQNIWILKNLSFLKILGAPILIGTSRKTFIGKILNNEPKERVYGTLASNLIALKNGAKFLRVHDVKAHKEFFKVLEEIENG